MLTSLSVVSPEPYVPANRCSGLNPIGSDALIMSGNEGAADGAKVPTATAVIASAISKRKKVISYPPSDCVSIFNAA